MSNQELMKNLEKIINKSFILAGAGKLSKEDVKLIAEKVPDIKVLIKQFSPLNEFEDKIFQMITIIKKFSSGKEITQSWETVSACAFVIGYMMQDVDLIPDFVEDIGELDDLLVVKVMLELFHDEF